ncbi:uncharacterized protein LOC115691499 [Syzygium oleosum]|uniref:uncharacterized protein LOC115691499 n=1 Tax=Syzygium oleosum TaxID=219896 RepID=UPI0024B9D0A8|nr:uncharacterized protein LOC115691499 [Syzygium oleosum]
MVATTLWHIWKSRNNSIFRGQNPNAEETVEAAQVMEENYEKWGIHMAKIGNGREGAASPTWIAPERGRLKINVDGSLVEGSTDGAIACICRDHTGVLVDGLTKSVKASSVAQVETLAVLEPMRFAKHRSLKEVIVQSDRLELIRTLSGADQVNWEIRVLIKECRDLLVDLPLLQLKYCPRSSNSVADLAAKNHRNQLLPLNWLSSPPPALWALLCKDAPLLGSATLSRL